MIFCKRKKKKNSKNDLKKREKIISLNLQTISKITENEQSLQSYFEDVFGISLNKQRLKKAMDFLKNDKKTLLEGKLIQVKNLLD